MDATGFAIGIGAAATCAAVTTYFALTLTIAKHREAIDRLQVAVAKLIEERQRYADRLGSLERDLSWLFTPKSFDEDEIIRKLKEHAHPASNVGITRQKITEPAPKPYPFT